MFDGYEWQGCRLQVEEYSDSKPTETQNEMVVASPSVEYVPPPTTAATIDPIIPPPPPPSNAMYRYNEIQPPLHLSHPPPPPPPPIASSSSSSSILPQVSPVPPMYSYVGGPAANLPTHGHNQIFVNNVSFA